MATSAVPAAVDALVDLVTAAAADQKVRVVDGPPTVDATSVDQVFIGWQPDTAISVALQQDFASAGARRRDETFNIGCYIESRSGSDDMRARRHRVFELAALLENTLRATDLAPTAPTLTGTVLWAHLVTGDLQQMQGPETCTAGLSVYVACRARI